MGSLLLIHCQDMSGSTCGVPSPLPPPHFQQKSPVVHTCASMQLHRVHRCRHKINSEISLKLTQQITRVKIREHLPLYDQIGHHHAPHLCMEQPLDLCPMACHPATWLSANSTKQCHSIWVSGGEGYVNPPLLPQSTVRKRDAATRLMQNPLLPSHAHSGRRALPGLYRKPHMTHSHVPLLCCIADTSRASPLVGVQHGEAAKQITSYYQAGSFPVEVLQPVLGSRVSNAFQHQQATAAISSSRPVQIICVDTMA